MKGRKAAKNVVNKKKHRKTEVFKRISNIWCIFLVMNAKQSHVLMQEDQWQKKTMQDAPQRR